MAKAGVIEYSTSRLLSPVILVCKKDGRLYPMFRGFTQQDSQEFLRYFMDQLHEELREPVHSSHEDEESEMEDDEDLSSASLSEREESQSETEYETCDSGVSEQSSASSSQHRSKRKKRQHGVDVEAGMSHRSSNRNLILPDHDPSEFSDAVSDTTLLDTESAGGLSSTTSPQVHSSGTSGIGSSKPSMASLTSSYRDPVLSCECVDAVCAADDVRPALVCLVLRCRACPVCIALIAPEHLWSK
ncbi:ubiquitin carboxyl-terminal hydrolase 20-like isoform X2 [Penaeus indicus]|uniref:ubiquitin carboxyl-terminal hydrolase 20-like isoform X2 n=1 Tax=Penaeus indicus TaxID=29960 RepID=UPI00300C4810